MGVTSGRADRVPLLESFMRRVSMLDGSTKSKNSCISESIK